jgi:glutathione S-transferase
MSSQLDVMLNMLAGTARGWRGTSLRARAGKAPKKTLKLYDIEASPYCRLVREALCEMDLDALILPCPVGGTRYRSQARRRLPGTRFPLLVDDNTGVVMNESADIIDYLARTYGSSLKSQQGLGRGLAVASSVLASALQYRPGGLQGLNARPSKAPRKPLVLYSFESSPYSKPVRARLCELQLPYLLKNTPKGALTDLGPPLVRDRLFKAGKGTTRHRAWLAEHTGRVQLPYLVDPNTGAAMYESADILSYLDATYGR